MRLWAHLILKPTCLSNPRLKQLTGHVSPMKNPLPLRPKPNPMTRNLKWYGNLGSTGLKKSRILLMLVRRQPQQIQVMIECRSTAAISNRNSRRPPVLFWHHRQHVSPSQRLFKSSVRWTGCGVRHGTGSLT